jgi:hypothetical protein
LKLDAYWVVLSACNTAPGDKPGAGALSALARASFYAGAHLGRHALAVDTFDALQTDHKIGRSKALQKSMPATLR